MSQETAPKRTKVTSPRKKESFASGLLSLMAKQCIFSALLFTAIYVVKNTDLAFSEPVCAFVKNIVGYEVTSETIKNIASGLFS